MRPAPLYPLALDKPYVDLEWLERFRGYTENHQATMDASQEALLLDECNRLQRDINTTLEVGDRFSVPVFLMWF